MFALSIMINLGKVAKKPPDNTIIDVSTFHLESFTWSLVPVRAEFLLSSTHFEEDDFRRAYKATSPTPEFKVPIQPVGVSDNINR